MIHWIIFSYMHGNKKEARFFKSDFSLLSYEFCEV